MNIPCIVRIPVLPLGMVNCHLIVGSSGCVLVDAGLPGSASKVERALARIGRSMRDVRLIVVTHAHVDHAGSADEIRALTGAPIVAHAGDLPHYEQRLPMGFCETGWFGRLFMKTGLILQPYRPFTPDLLLSGTQSLDLQAFGVAGWVRHTPGHTTGSLSVQLACGDALVGDLLASGIGLGGVLRTGHAMRPPFEDSPQVVAAQLQALLETGAAHFYLGHGGPLPAAEVRRHAAWLQTQRPGHRYEGLPARLPRRD